MQRSLLLKAMGCMAAGICLLDVQAQAQQRIVNGGFESGLTGWTQLDQVGSDGSFFAQSGTASPINAFPVPAPPQGTKAAMTDAQAGGSHVLYQDFTVPFAVTSGTVSFSLYLNSGNAFITPSTLDWAGTDRNGGLNLNQQGACGHYHNRSRPVQRGRGRCASKPLPDQSRSLAGFRLYAVVRQHSGCAASASGPNPAAAVRGSG